MLYERGLFDTRIGDIADRAGTSSATILYWFESKDRLLEEAVDYADREFYDGFLSAGDSDERAGHRLVRFIEELSHGPEQSSDYTLWLEIWVRARRDPSVRQSYIRLDRRQRSLIAQIVRQGQAEGDFDPGTDPDEFALSLSGMLDGLGVQVTLGQPDVSPERMVRCCLRLAASELGCDFGAAGDGRSQRGLVQVDGGAFRHGVKEER